MGKSILIVDDDPSILQMMALMLKKIQPDARICTANTVKDALNHMAKIGFDVIISDYELPDGNGKSIFTQSQPNILKIGISGLYTHEDFEATATHFLRKPFGFDALKSFFDPNQGK